MMHKLTYPCPNGARLTGTRQAIRRAISRGKDAKNSCLDLQSWLRFAPPSARRGR